VATTLPGIAASTGACPGGVNASTSTNVAVATAVQNIMALYPYPNYVAAAGNGVGRAIVEDPNTGNENYVLGRVDYTISAKDAIFARYMLDYANRDAVALGAANAVTIPYWPEYDRTRDNFAAVEWHRIVTPTVVNVLHAGFSRTYEDAYVYGSPTVSNGVASPGSILTPAAGQFAGPQPAAGALLSAGVHPLQFFNTTNPGSLTYAVTTAAIGIPREDGTVAAGSGITSIGASSTLPFYLVPNKFQYADDVIWTHGAHTITAGASFKRIEDNTWAPFVVGPQWTFQNLAGFVAGNSTNLNGQVSDTQAPEANSVKDFRYWIFEPYINDTWKVNNRLTVNIGSRYSPTTQINESKQPELDLLVPPYGQWTQVTTSNATNPSLDNWDPRVGLAWDVFGDHKTSIRASFGEFHSIIYSRDENYWLEPPFLTDAQTLSSVSLTGAPAPISFPTPYTNLPVNAATLTSIPQNGSLSCTNCNYFGVHSTPHQIQWNFNIEHEVMANTVASVGYVGSHGIDLWAQKDFNFPIGEMGPSGLLTYGTYNAASNSMVPNPRPNPAYNYLSMADTVAYSHYNALQASLNRRFSRGFQLQVSYTYSKSIDDSSGTYGLDGGGAFSNPESFTADRGLSNFNRTDNFRVSGVYNLPYTGHGVVGQALGGWQMNAIYTYLSGAPFSIGTISNRLTNQAAYASPRPNAVAGCDLYTGVSAEQAASGRPWFNVNCFAPAPVGTFGDAGRDTIIGPNLWDMDFALQKNWKVKENFRIQFKAEAFNVLNHPSFQAPIATAFNPALSPAVLTNPLAGTVPNASAGVITATNSSPRQVQLALKVVF
jgi:hypothetical protein